MSWQIAIDGPAGSGKSTVSKAIASKLGFEYVDTGAMYRTVTLKALALKIDLEKEEEYNFLEETIIDFIDNQVFLDGRDVSKDIRSIVVTNNVSLVSKFKYVREKMVAIQQKLAKEKNIIMDGRDIGTVVLPNANLKVYLNANVEERARRRMLERELAGYPEQNFEETIEEIVKRDYKDSNREISPLKKADDAIEIDSSNLNVEEVVEKIISLVSKRGYRMENLEQKQEIKETEEQDVEVVTSEETVETPTTVEEESKEVESKEAVETVAEKEEENPVKYKELQIVTGTVIEVRAAQPEKKFGNKVVKAKEERVLIELEDGQEGFLFKKDTANIGEDENLFDLFVEGDKVDVAIKQIFPDGGKFIFSTVLVEKRNELKKFEDVIKERQILTAKVVKQTPVGLLLKVENFSCLLPNALVAVNAEEIPALVGKEIEIIPIRIDYSRIRLIVSQIAAASQKAKAEKKDFISQLEVGQVYDGVVKNVENYGAFVEIHKGIEGLLHISEIEHNRIFKVDKVLNIGDSVKVQIIKLEKDHIGLSRKALIPNYFGDFTEKTKVDDVVKGKVVELNKAGLVVELTDGVTGFLPKSECAWENNVALETVASVNDELDLKVIEIDTTKKRIILSKKKLSENPWSNLNVKVGDVVAVRIDKILDEGFNVSLQGVVGYLPKASVKSKDPATIQIGEELTVKIKVLDTAKTRLIVNMRDAEEKAEKDNYSKYMKSEDKLSNTFGDFMKNLKK